VRVKTSRTLVEHLREIERELEYITQQSNEPTTKLHLHNVRYKLHVLLRKLKNDELEVD